MVPDPSPPFDVSSNGVANDQVRQLLERAKKAGILQEISREMNDIMLELRDDPRNFGEIYLNLRYGDMQGFLAVMHKLRVLYTVHRRIPMVIIVSVVPLTDHPLYRGEEN